MWCLHVIHDISSFKMERKSRDLCLRCDILSLTTQNVKDLLFPLDFICAEHTKCRDLLDYPLLFK